MKSALLSLLCALVAVAGPSPEDLAAAVEQLGDDNPAAREEARRTILAWGGADPEGVIAALPETSPDAEIRASLVRLRKRLQGMAATLKRDERAMAAAGKDEALRRATEGLLRSLKDEALLAPAQDAPERLPETDGVTTQYVLGTYEGGKPAMCRVLEVLLQDGDIGVRRIAARLLYYHGSAENRAALTGAMGDEDPYIRGGAALSLSHHGVKDAGADIRRLLGDADPMVRLHAGMALEELELVLDEKEILEMLLSKDAATRATGISLLVNRRAAGQLDRIGGLLEDPDPDVRRQAVRAVEALGGFRWDAEAARERDAQEWWRKRKAERK